MIALISVCVLVPVWLPISCLEAFLVLFIDLKVLLSKEQKKEKSKKILIAFRKYGQLSVFPRVWGKWELLF